MSATSMAAAPMAAAVPGGTVPAGAAQHPAPAGSTATSDALPVTPERLAAYFRGVDSFQTRQARDARRWGKVAWTIAGISLAANLVLATAVAAMLPLQRLVPLYLWLRPDGTVDSTARLSAIPPTRANAVLRAAIWQYVRDRQSYDFADAEYRYDVVSLMSAPAVLDAYQQAFLPANPASPQNTIGRKGQIAAAMVSMSFVRRHVALVRYRRTVLRYDGGSVTTTWTATVGFRQATRLPTAARLADPGGLIVTNYQNSEDTP